MTPYIENKTRWHWFLEDKGNGKYCLNWFWNDEQNVKDANEHFSDEDFDFITLDQIAVDKHHPELTVICYLPDGYSDIAITILTTANRIYGPIKFAGALRDSSYECVGV